MATSIIGNVFTGWNYTEALAERDPHRLPDVFIAQRTAEEAAEELLGQDDDAQCDLLKRFPLMVMNSREWRRAIDAYVAEENVTGGFFYWFGTPGCMWDSGPYGPFSTVSEALIAAREDCDLSAEGTR